MVRHVQVNFLKNRLKGPFGTEPADPPDSISFDDLLGNESEL